MEYIIVKAPNTQDLVDEINKLISQGFRPQGGLTCRPTTEYVDALYAQAMIKE